MRHGRGATFPGNNNNIQKINLCYIPGINVSNLCDGISALAATKVETSALHKALCGTYTLHIKQIESTKHNQTMVVFLLIFWGPRLELCQAISTIFHPLRNLCIPSCCAQETVRIKRDVYFLHLFLKMYPGVHCF